MRTEDLKRLALDRIRGSLMAGAAGDALGYPVEFLDRKTILARFGDRGIAKFLLDRDGRALVSDDTQMTLFTANGILVGATRGHVLYIKNFVGGAYVDWYYTQTGVAECRSKHTWLRDLPRLAHRRAPGITCLSSCENMMLGKAVDNNSKGCGGIMRVAPMALFMAGCWSRGESVCDERQMDEAGAEIAAVTHKHPLAFLPSAMLTHLIYRLIRMDYAEAKTNIAAIALETVDALYNIYGSQYETDKHCLANLTRMAVELAANQKSDTDNIRQLGEGWVAEETWAIALYSAVRHVDSVEDAIIAAVNHDGDSDSTGSVCGNIMGAIHGYEAIMRQRLFCPEGKALEPTLELSDLILAIADDLFTGCSFADGTPEKRQWEERYCKMMPAGI